MTVAEVLLFALLCVGIYYLLRPVQRWLEARLMRRAGRPRDGAGRHTIDVTDFRSYSHKKDDDQHEHGA